MDTLAALRAFHAGERRLFERLLSLGEDPFLSKKIMAFWLWLESVGYHDLLQRIQSHSDRFLLLIAAEAETCLSCLENTIRPTPSPSSSSSSIPITASLTEQPLSLAHLERHRELARTGMSHLLNGVCALVFNDIIIHRGMGGARFGQLTMMHMGGESSSSGGGGGFSAALCGAGLSTVAGLYNPWSRPFHVMNAPLINEGEGSELLAFRSTLLHVGSATSMDLNPMERSWTVEVMNPSTTEEQRCLFVTFSRGYPLSRGEIIDFFTESWGDCVENVYVESSTARDGPLYGRVIFRTREIVSNVLNGQEKVKFSVNGKPLWGRMYRPKRVTS